jgi:WD40 repeat protein
VADRSLLWTGGPSRSAGDDRWERAALEPDAAAFSPDGQVLAVATGASSDVSVHRARDGKPLRTLAASKVRALAFSPSGTFLAVAADRAVQLWRLEDWKYHGEIPGRFTALAFSPDGTTLLAAEQDGVLRLYYSFTPELE